MARPTDKRTEMERLAANDETKLSFQISVGSADRLSTMFAPLKFKSRSALLRSIVDEWIERNI
jgi:hypothetical protein